MPRLLKYFSIFYLVFVHGLKNYKALIGLSIFLVTCLVIFAHLWRVAASKIGVISFSPEQLLWYIAFNEWVLVAVPDVQDAMEKDLRSGRLSYLLPRPISYIGATLAEATGTLCANLMVLGFITFIFTWFQAGSLPFHPIGIIPALFFGLLAGLVALLFRMIIGISAFWLQDVDPIFWIWEKLLFMFGGLMLPLAVYPQWMQSMAYFTPFPAILGQRSALALEFNWNEILMLSATLIVWTIIGILSLVFIYRKGLRILNIEGG